jgi:hypothetical protein
LLEDDNEWDRCLNDASTLQMLKQMRSMFAFLYVFCDPNGPLMLWNKYKTSMCEDFTFQSVNDVENRALLEIESVLKVHGMKLSDYRLPMTRRLSKNLNVEFNKSEEAKDADGNVALLNEEQRLGIEDILHAINSNEVSSKCFFIDGPGGTG